MVVCVLAVAGTVFADAEGLEADLAVLRNKGISSDGADLLTFFKKRTMSETKRKKIAGLIGMLGDEDFTTREKATTDLIDIGAPARPMLSAALRDNDLEVRRRARRALDAIGPVAEEATLLPAAARVLAHRKPAGAVEVLLEFLPNIEDTATAEDVARIVGPVALDKTGKPEPAVLLALSDRQWIKRYAAAEALARIAAQRPLVRKLLKDHDSGVRRRVALALLNARDKEAVPSLIALLTSDSREDADAAEEMLTVLAGEKSPSAPDEHTPMARERYRKQWESWWKDAEGTLDLAKIDLMSAGQGYTLIGVVDNRNMGKLQELDTAGKVRWTINNLQYPVHARKIRRDRVLICEYLANNVTERDLKGKVLWEQRVLGQPLSAQRLPNGNTFIVTRQQMMEVDKSHREVKVYPRTAIGGLIVGAERHKDGTITAVTTTGQCVQLDREGRHIRSFSVSGGGPGRLFTTTGLKIQFLPKGGVIVPDYRLNAVREYDATGKLLWEKSLGGLTRPTAVTRLPNGHTLVGSLFANRIIELYKEGKEVSSKPVDGRLMFLDRK
jgi:HEAT repeat protein